jgi:hypothetical protein
MVANSVAKKMSEFDVVLINPKKQKINLRYKLVEDSEIAHRWFNKCMKHLKRVSPDPVESRYIQVDLRVAYIDFCNLVGIEPTDMETIDQEKLNFLHHQFIDHVTPLMNKKETFHIAQNFHNAIHMTEALARGYDTTDMKPLRVNYGLDGQPFKNTDVLLNRYADRVMEKNCLYLLIGESGKSPTSFFEENEEITDENIAKIMVANVSFTPEWFINIKRKVPPRYSKEFLVFFDKVKERFFKKYEQYGLDQWPEHYEYSTVRLANPLHPYDTLKLFIDGYRYHSVLID